MNINKKLPFSILSFGVEARWSVFETGSISFVLCQRLQLLTTERYKRVCEVCRVVLQFVCLREFLQ